MNWRFHILVPGILTALMLHPWPARAADPEPNLAPQIQAITNVLRGYVAGAPEKITIRNLQGSSILLEYTEWRLKSLPQSAQLSMRMEKEAMALPEAERLKVMNRFNDFSQVWLFPVNQNPPPDAKLKEFLTPIDRPNRYHRELTFVGTGQGYAWYTWMPIFYWTDLQEKLNLAGGEDALAAQVRGLSIDDPGGMTHNSAEPRLVAGRTRSIPYLKTLLKFKVQGKEMNFQALDSPFASPGFTPEPVSPHYQSALYMLARIKAPQSADILFKAVQGPVPALAQGARRALEFYPRSDAAPLYLRWLDLEAGKTNVFPLLLAAVQFEPKNLDPYLTRILEKPHSIQELRLAFETSRTNAGKPIPAQLLNLEKEIQKFGYASGTNFNQAKVDDCVKRIIASGDSEAAGVIAMSLLTARTKGDLDPANQAGVSILKALPKKHGLDLARRAVGTLSDDWVTQKLKKDLGL